MILLILSLPRLFDALPERLWKLVDEPLVNKYFETIEEIEEILVDRCNYLREEMQSEIKNLTNYHWLNWD